MVKFIRFMLNILILILLIAVLAITLGFMSQIVIASWKVGLMFFNWLV